MHRCNGRADALAHLLGSAPAATTGGAGELAAILGGDMRAPTADVRPSLLDKLVAAAQPLSPAGTETSASVTHLSVSTAASTPTRRSYKSSTTAARLTEIEQALRNGVADHTPAYEKGQTVLTKVFRAFDPDGCGHISSGAFRKLLGVFEIEASESEARAIVASSPRPSNPPVERALYYDKYISHLFVRFKPRRRSDDSSASLGGSALSATGGGSRAAVAASAHTAPPRASSGNPSAPLRHEETQVKEAIASARVGAANSGAGALCGTADEAAAVFLDEVVALHTSAARDHGGVGATLVRSKSSSRAASSRMHGPRPHLHRRSKRCSAVSLRVRRLRSHQRQRLWLTAPSTLYFALPTRMWVRTISTLRLPDWRPLSHASWRHRQFIAGNISLGLSCAIISSG